MSSSSQGNEEACYHLNPVDKLKEDTDSLASLVDQLLLVNPESRAIAKISDLPPQEFAVRKYQRPAGYAATTRVHFGRLCIPILADSGARCNCLTEEAVVMLVNHTFKMLSDKAIQSDAYNFPIVQFFKYTNVAQLRGAGKTEGMLVEYALFANVEFFSRGRYYRSSKANVY